MTEWSGAFGDTDPFWAANPSIATQLGFANKNDGDFFISLSDFLNPNYFNFITQNYNPATWFNSYWLALGNGDAYGVAGTTTYCGT